MYVTFGLQSNEFLCIMTKRASGLRVEAIKYYKMENDFLERAGLQLWNLQQFITEQLIIIVICWMKTSLSLISKQDMM